jgi:hypothetical protein
MTKTVFADVEQDTLLILSKNARTNLAVIDNVDYWTSRNKRQTPALVTSNKMDTIFDKEPSKLKIRDNVSLSSDKKGSLARSL